ncbi:hypothetical protein GCM10010246_80420 [Streptomyces cuspidosporus]|uniref:Uncharacterized protein n=1 Tax=Streptomyces cuspidosporus TaxID=66882 RepID=A0ABN3H9S1_9ACTN
MTHAQPGSADVLTRPDTEAVAGITRSGRDVDRVAEGLRHFHTSFTAYHDTERSKPGHVPFGELKGRRFEKPNVNLVQHYGRFLAGPGRRIRNVPGAVPCRDEPVVKPPEVGGLPGVSIRELDGLPRRLLWKGGPGNPPGANGALTDVFQPERRLPPATRSSAGLWPPGTDRRSPCPVEDRTVRSAPAGSLALGHGVPPSPGSAHRETFPPARPAVEGR